MSDPLSANRRHPERAEPRSVDAEERMSIRTGSLPGSGCPEAGSAFDGMVVLGGRLVHVLHDPGPGPAIVLLGGCGVLSQRWDAVAVRLGEHRVVRLDRPGLEGTPWPGRLPTLRDEVDILADLLTGLDGPAVVSGDAVASVIAEYSSYPEQVWDLARLRAERTFPAVPVRVLTAPGGKRWFTAQAALAAMLGGEHEVIAGSRHLMMIDRPDA